MFNMTMPVKRKVIESKIRFEAGINFDSTSNIHRHDTDYVIY